MNEDELIHHVFAMIHQFEIEHYGSPPVVIYVNSKTRFAMLSSRKANQFVTCDMLHHKWAGIPIIMDQKLADWDIQTR